MVLLEQRKEAAAATAEALFETFEDNGALSRDSPYETEDSLSLNDPMELTQEFVQQKRAFTAQQPGFSSGNKDRR